MNAPALWTSSDAATATGGSSPRDWSATGVSIDSRTLSSGDLFVAIKGPVHDGHEHVPGALAQGAAAAMVSQPIAKAPKNAPLLTVVDTLEALAALGREARNRTAARIVAVTGSVGKTGTKEALRLVLGQQGETCASQSSFNNHWGVPLSLARLPASARFGVFEIGMNHPGEITPLVQLVRPHVAIVTTVESAHTEFFASVAEIADAKAEIFAGLEPAGTAVLNRDNPHFDRLAKHAKAAGVSRIVSFGCSEDADARVLRWERCDGGTRIEARFDGGAIDYVIGVPGEHWVMNSLAVLAAASALGADIDKAAAALADLAPLTGRGETHRLSLATGVVTLIDESYNANPASMRAAIANLGGTATERAGRRIAVLGDMRELGKDSAKMHAALATVLDEHKIDLVFLAGSEMAHLAAALPASRRGGEAESGDALADRVIASLGSDDVVMVKGSNASGMKSVVTAMRDAADERSGKVKA